MRDTVFDIGLNFIIGLFIIVVIYFVGFVMGGGYLYPMLQTMAPSNTTGGMSNADYVDNLDNAWWGMKVTFYIFLTAVFLVVGVKLFYEREETSAGVY